MYGTPKPYSKSPASLARHRNRSCVGSDGAVYDDSFCVGSCMDLDPEYDYGYPTR